MKVQDLQGAELDYWVSQRNPSWHDDRYKLIRHSRGLICYYINAENLHCIFSPSTNWAYAGPIIEHKSIAIMPVDDGIGKGWMAYIQPRFEQFGETPLIAAMRCYIMSVCGEEVSQPPDKE